MTPTYETYVTIKNGAEATIKGHPDAIEAIEAALMSAKFHYNNKLETWDNGFYTPSREEA